MELLAHRGYWKHPAEKNSQESMHLAFSHGYGVETDIRDFAGKLVISHDIPIGVEYTFDMFLELYLQYPNAGTLALNVKADGLQDMAKEALERYGVSAEKYFFFDMSVPDALQYLKRGQPCFTRASDVEVKPCFFAQAQGVWLDAFASDWFSNEVITHFVQMGKKLALVSPELHGRPHKDVWTRWKPAILQIKKDGLGNSLMLCTDYPLEAQEFFDA